MNEKAFSHSSAKRVAKQIVDVKDDKRKKILKQMPTDLKLRVVEEMVKIRLERMRDDNGNIAPAKVSER